MLLRVWERKKVVPDPYIAMKIGKTVEIFEEWVCGNILPAGARRDRNRQQAETGRKNQAGIGGQKETGTDNRLEEIGRKNGGNRQKQQKQKEAGTGKNRRKDCRQDKYISTDRAY